MFVLRKKRYCTIQVAKTTKALISFVVTVFVFAYAKRWFSHDMAHMYLYCIVTLFKKIFFIFSGGSLTVSPGQVVHPECRRLYCHPNQGRETPSKENVKPILSPNTRASVENRFSFNTKCFFCGTPAKFNERRRGQNVFEVRTLKFQDTVREKCITRNDEWGKDVWDDLNMRKTFLLLKLDTIRRVVLTLGVVEIFLLLIKPHQM